MAVNALVSRGLGSSPRGPESLLTALLACSAANFGTEQLVETPGRPRGDAEVVKDDKQDVRALVLGAALDAVCRNGATFRPSATACTTIEAKNRRGAEMARSQTEKDGPRPEAHVSRNDVRNFIEDI